MKYFNDNCVIVCREIYIIYKVNLRLHKNIAVS